MRRLLACVLLLALVASGTALADRGDPKRAITKADQARARAMLLRRADLPAGFTSIQPRKAAEEYCKALDESDLTLTGEALGQYVRQGGSIASVAQVYASLADANTSWRRGTSKAGVQCLGEAFRRQLLREGLRDVTFGPLAFPRLAQRSVAFRLTGFFRGIPAFVDVVVLQQSRAHAALFMSSALQPVLKPDQVRFARIVAGRMARAMRRP